MAVDFPNNRPEAGLGTGPLQEGDSWRFNSIEYTWVLSPDGTGMWSSKGINVNPDNYIAKTDKFEDAGGDIEGYYSKPGGFNVLNAETANEADNADKLDGQHGSYYQNASNLNAGTISDARLPDNISSNISGTAANADKLDNEEGSYYRNASNINAGTLNDARLPDTISSNITGNAATASNADNLDGQGGSYYRNASNINAGTLNDARLPNTITSNITGNAATADVADRVEENLTIRFFAAGNTGTTPDSEVVYNGDNARSIDIRDTDSATAILDVAAGDGLSEPTPNTLTVDSSVARINSGYAMAANRTTKLNAGSADNADKLDGQESSFYRNASNLNAGTISDSRLPDTISSNITGSAAFATTSGLANDANQLGGETPGYYLDYNNLSNKPVIEGQIVYTGGDGISIDSSNEISANSTIARSTSGYATNSSGTRLRSLGTQGTLTINQGGTQKGVFDGSSNVTVNLDASSNGTTQNLQSVLDTGTTATGTNANIKLTSSGNEVILYGTAGVVELTRTDGPFINFKRPATEDYDNRIDQQGNNLVIQSKAGNVFVEDVDHGTFQITPGGDSGDNLHRVTRFNIRQEMDDANIDATLAFNRAINWVYGNFDTPSIYFPSGSYDITSVTFPYNTSKTQISIFGDGKGQGTEIICNGIINVGHPVNIKDLKFTGRVNGPTLSFRRNPTNSNDSSNPLQDDMDSTITNCDFGNGGSEQSPPNSGNYIYPNACDIEYRGRNLIVIGCKFITGGPSGQAIRLSYFCNSAEPVSQDEVGWKRIMITNNNFHNFDGGAIVLGSSQNTVNGIRPRLRGLVVANNTAETDGVFMRHQSGSNCRLEGAAITGNTILIYKDKTAIDLQDVYASSIVGNTFNGYAEDGRTININIDNAWATTVTGNVFNSGQGSGGNGALSGNTWRGCVVESNTWFGARTGRINITSTPDSVIQNPVGIEYEP